MVIHLKLSWAHSQLQKTPGGSKNSQSQDVKAQHVTAQVDLRAVSSFRKQPMQRTGIGISARGLDAISKSNLEGLPWEEGLYRGLALLSPGLTDSQVNASWKLGSTYDSVLVRPCVRLRWLEMTCALFGRDQICTQVDASFLGYFSLEALFFFFLIASPFSTQRKSLRPRPQYAEEICSLIPTIRPTVHTNPSWKRSFTKTLFETEEFENAGFWF